MLLGEVLAVEAPPVEITGLAYDNRAVEEGTLFFCVRGFTRDGHEFAPDALANGAAALVVDHPLGLGVPEVVVDDVRAAMAPAAARFYGDPTARLRMAGVTGTNGKTTTCFLIREMLVAAGMPTGLLGTVTSFVGGVERPTVRTTPEAIDLQCTFAEMVDGGDVACAMEVSSHALDLARADAIAWDVAVFTNLSQDHLDFHPSMEAYFLAKRKLFEAAGDAVKVINCDDDYGRRLAAEFPGATTYSLRDVEDLEVDFTGSRFTFEGTRFATPHPGAFNVSNALAAIHTARALGAGDDVIASALGRAARVPGRFEPVDEGQDFAVIVDYSHTPDALENVLRAARELAGWPDQMVIVVFGCGGDRDRAKRPLMGRIAAELADAQIVTSDNPRSEDPMAIIEEIASAMEEEATIQPDRRLAIRDAIWMASTGDVVVIAGKGHEQGQEFADGRKEPFDDVVVAREELRRARVDA